MSQPNILGLNADIIRPVEGFHRAINTVKDFEEYTIRFYTEVLGGVWNKNIRSSIATIMPWAVNLTPKVNNSPIPNFVDGPELSLFVLHGIQFVCNLEEHFSKEKQLEEKSYFGFILNAQETLKNYHVELKAKIQNFNDSVEKKLFANHTNFNPAIISEITFDSNKIAQFYVEDMYRNKIEYKCSEMFDKFPGVSCWPGLTSYKACVNVASNKINEIKAFYTQILGADFVNKNEDELTLNLHGIEFQYQLDNHFEYLEHTVLEPAHFGFNIESIETFELLHSALESKIEKFNMLNKKNNTTHEAKIYPIATRKISGFAHAAFFVRDMCYNFFEMKCFYKI